MLKRKLSGLMALTMAGVIGVGAAMIGFAMTGLAMADLAPRIGHLSTYSDPQGVVLAVETPFAAEHGQIRLSIYDDEASFLEQAAAKHKAVLDDKGVAIMRLGAIEPGAYAFVAYYDENGDGVLNRGKVLGRPKEPYGFSNGVKPKLRKPKFEEAKVDVVPGDVVVITLDE